ncbi:MAG: thiamine-phosphate kinase [Verrucomicrobiota bacterium]
MLAEDRFYDNLFRRLPELPTAVRIPPGDDCAAVEHSPGLLTLYTVDQVAADVHYDKNGENPVHPGDIARKLLARNISDIAAMGGRALYCLISVVQQSEKEEWLNAFFDGLSDYARRFGIAVIGGDIISAPDSENASLTLIGEIEAERACRRQGAESGDVLLATGYFGNSLTSGWHMTFEPRYNEGKWLAEQGFAKAMIDVSDGLLLDAFRLCTASQASLTLNLSSIPLRTSETTVRRGLTDGEDYELLFAVAPDKVKDLLRQWPFTTRVTEIGVFSSGLPPVIEDPQGNQIAPADNIGYQHLM